MHYRIYLDSFFMQETVVNFYVLLLCRICFVSRVSLRRLLVASAMSGIYQVLLLFIPFPKNAVSFYLLCFFMYVLGGFFVIRFSFGKSIFQVLFKRIAAYMSFTLMIGGIFQGILPRISFYNDSKVKIISFLIAGGAVYFFLWKVYEEKRNNMYYGKLKVEHKGISLEGNYFLDSGNKLVESISGKPVLVTSAKWLFGPLSPEMLFLRPVVYKSVGKEKGVLDAYCVDLVVIYGKERTYKYEKVWVGICREELFSGKDYQIILPPLYGVQEE